MYSHESGGPMAAAAGSIAITGWWIPLWGSLAIAVGAALGFGYAAWRRRGNRRG